MHNPPHPGVVVKRQCLEPFDLTVPRVAKGLGVTRQALSELANEHPGIPVEMAIRLSKAFGSTPENWLGCTWLGIRGRPGDDLGRSRWSISRRRDRRVVRPETCRSCPARLPEEGQAWCRDPEARVRPGPAPIAGRRTALM